MPVSRRIVPQECPWERKAAILAPSTATLGLPEPLAFGPRIPDTCADTLGDKAALKLGDGAKHSENHFAGGRGGVNLSRKGNDVNSGGLKRFERTKQVITVMCADLSSNKVALQKSVL